LPEQIVVSDDLIDKVGVGLTVITVLPEAVHEPVVPVTEYVTVPVGFAYVLVHVLQVKPVEGLQV
jgi:hypothetical protein